MKKKFFVIAFLILSLSGFSFLNATEIKGKVTDVSKGEPYTHGSVLLEPIGTENRFEAKIDKEGNYSFQNIEMGRYLLWMDLYSATPAGGEQREIAVQEGDETLEFNFDISLSILDKTLVFTKETSDFIWMPLMVVLLFLIGITLTIVTRLIQVRRLWRARSPCLDVDRRLLRDGHQVRRRLFRSQVQDKE